MVYNIVLKRIRDIGDDTMLEVGYETMFGGELYQMILYNNTYRLMGKPEVISIHHPRNKFEVMPGVRVATDIGFDKPTRIIRTDTMDDK